jgi:maltose O-acetyltransferase
MFGPNVSLMATTHPLLPEERIAMKYNDGHISMSEYAPEIYIGNNAVVGAGSVVTKDILENYLAYGNPCRPVRFISEKDSKLNLL